MPCRGAGLSAAGGALRRSPGTELVQGRDPSPLAAGRWIFSGHSSSFSDISQIVFLFQGARHLKNMYPTLQCRVGVGAG